MKLIFSKAPERGEETLVIRGFQRVILRGPLVLIEECGVWTAIAEQQRGEWYVGASWCIDPHPYFAEAWVQLPSYPIAE